ncbi:signal peptidase I [Candidatus Marithrix sp. Canyon 246]|uniref:signal peptidase I n=1 Tax=Candidatus Marithrix sp. Canyon 246 TaxID=1827136 RepID=UPI000849FADC|nr:signal peptidase I [Candidatus Marithrix sp. Canyon 246]
MNIKNSIANTIFDLWQENDKESQLKLSGHSMTPVIKNGDWLTLKHNSNDIRVGSIIAYRRERKIIVHRVIKIQNDSLITKGDFNCYLDEVVDIKSVIGKVIAVKNRRLDTKVWYVIGYIIASTPFIFTHIYRLIRNIKSL